MIRQYYEKIPKWYGLAWHRPEYDNLVCLPLGINYIAAFGHWLWLIIMRARPFSRWVAEERQSARHWKDEHDRYKKLFEDLVK